MWQIIELEFSAVGKFFTALKLLVFSTDQVAILIFVLGPANHGALRSCQTIDVRFEKSITSAKKEQKIEVNITIIWRIEISCIIIVYDVGICYATSEQILSRNRYLCVYILLFIYLKTVVQLPFTTSGIKINILY